MGVGHSVGLANVREELAYCETVPVYFAQARRTGEIKIGFSTQVANRLYTLGNQRFTTMDLLGWLPGGPALERNMHKKFADYRISAEWFEPDPVLLHFIADETREGEPENMTYPYGRLNDSHYSWLVNLESRLSELVEVS